MARLNFPLPVDMPGRYRVGMKSGRVIEDLPSLPRLDLNEVQYVDLWMDEESVWHRVYTGSSVPPVRVKRTPRKEPTPVFSNREHTLIVIFLSLSVTVILTLIALNP